jgi:hypothetical protein
MRFANLQNLNFALNLRITFTSQRKPLWSCTYVFRVPTIRLHSHKLFLYKNGLIITTQIWQHIETKEVGTINRCWKRMCVCVEYYTTTKNSVFMTAFRNASLQRMSIKLVKLRYPCYRPWRPIGLREVKAPTLPRQTANRWRQGYQPYAPAALYHQVSLLLKIPGTHVC